MHRHTHFYWYMKGNSVSYGRLSHPEHPWRSHRVAMDWSELLEQLAAIGRMPGTTLLFYFHGFMADITPVNREIFEVMDREMLPPDEPVVCIHIQWQAYSFYPAVHDWMKKQSLDPLQQFVDQVVATTSLGQLDILAHSMGSSLLHYLMHQDETFTNKIHRCVLAAPELSYDDFIQSQIWKNMQEKVLVLTTEGDKTLTMASFFKKDLKLGMATKQVEDHLIQGIVVNDFTKDEFWAGPYMRHRYFYTNPETRNQIRQFLYGK